MSQPRPSAVSIKIACVGGGSRYWVPTLVSDLALTPQLSGELALYDIDLAAAQRNVKLANRVFYSDNSVTSFSVTAPARIETALKHADFVILSILPGTLRHFANDLDIPLKYGVLQTVGDSTGPGGLSRALRTVPIFRKFAEQIMTHCPRAWVINYTNPMTVSVAALHAAAPGIRALGCCHEVQGAKNLLAQIFQKATGSPAPAPRAIKTDLAGVNHFTFFTSAQSNGNDLLRTARDYVCRPGVFDDQTATAREFEATARFDSSCGLVPLDFLRRFGAFGAAGDRHLVEFVPWYLTSIETLRRWGVVATPSSARLRTWRPRARHVLDVVRWYIVRQRARRRQSLQRSDEAGVDIILALLGLKDLDTNVNLPNQGQIAALPHNAVVETNAELRQQHVRPLVSRPLPAALNALVARVVKVQQMILEAALRCDKDLAFEALLSDPLCRLPRERAWEMLNELLHANRDALPGWSV